MNRIARFAVLALIGIVMSLKGSSLRADEGMWLFSNPPRKMLKEQYHFEPSDEWLKNVQQAAVRFNSGGSGAFVSPEGLVITNHHVAGHATRIVVILPSNEEVPAELVGTDPLADISVLLLKPEMKREFVPVEFGNSDAMRVGDSVLAMGSPLALSPKPAL